ncbi:MAG: rhodanese-like domain-containing protein [Prolixibacteraceae bacterium]
MLKNIQVIPLLLLVFFTLSCSNSQKKNAQNEEEIEEKSQVQTPVSIDQETSLLLKDLAENGDYVNSRNFPSLIKASSVYDELESNNLIIDLRTKEEFNAGHIKGAVLKAFSDLPAYFESGIKPFEYKRIILVSADGQTASYTTSLLRLMGYGNVYALRWGMSSWNAASANTGWLANCSSDFQNQLETTVNEAPLAKGLPKLNTGKTSGEEIGTARFNHLFSEGIDHIMIDASTVFSNPNDYYVVNYDRRDKYENGHIPGAVRYKPGATLSIVNEMGTLPTDKTIVVYCGTGHNSGFVTAYLRLFGYDARTLSYGNNSFMYDKMVNDKSTLSWLPFTSEEVHEYQVVK